LTCLKIDTRVALGPSRGDGDMINEVTLPALHHHHTALHCSLFAPLHTHDIGPHCAHYLPSNGVPIPDVSGGACDDEGWVWLLWVPATGAVVAGAVVGVVRWCGVVVLCCCNGWHPSGCGELLLQAVQILDSTKPNMIAMAAFGPFTLGALVPEAGQERSVHTQQESRRAGVSELALIGVTFGEPPLPPMHQG